MGLRLEEFTGLSDQSDLHIASLLQENALGRIGQVTWSCGQDIKGEGVAVARRHLAHPVAHQVIAVGSRGLACHLVGGRAGSSHGSERRLPVHGVVGEGLVLAGRGPGGRAAARQQKEVGLNAAPVAHPVVMDGHIGLVVADHPQPVQGVVGQVVVLVEHIGLRIGAGQQRLLPDLLAQAVAGQVVGVAGRSSICY